MEANAKKRSNSGAMPVRRLPLAETSTNLPLPVLKKQKTRAAAVPKTLKIEALKENADLQADPKQMIRKTEEKTAVTTSVVTATSTAAKSARLVGDELKSWQTSWRKIMRESVVYFDTHGCDSKNATQQQEQKRAHRALKLVGCEIVPFYDRDVTIIVSRRSFSSNKTYPPNDIFHDVSALKTKVWDFEKVFRFLKNLGVSESATQERPGNLSHLLKEEKIFGSTDRDPHARRDDLYYLEKNFIYVYDLSQAVRPIVVREWPNSSYPTFHLTLDGKCPFLSDPSDNLERKKLRRLQKFEATKEYRELLKKASLMIISAKGKPYMSESAFAGTSTSTDPREQDADSAKNESSSHANDTVVEEQEPDASAEDDMVGELRKVPFFRPPLLLSRNSSVIQPFHNNASNSKFYDVAASGYNGASNAMQFSMDSALNSVAVQNMHQGNGLGPATCQVPSKNLNNLKRRIFMKRQMSKKDDSKRESDARPGYCENCRVKYEQFEEHIATNRHRNFACNDKNFRDIDDLIATLDESKSMGYVSSNGDYSFTN
ncbi:regulatory subunit for Cdc7p protein kinase [Metschnikowia aff. pulcherrima]|uniref:Regulatory subunit for Cdc7p protein kinase n=1 Tax=Metschnikowia aff. pulcherrima TaxID=2163413 RepID=A0A4P6XLJ6_9ASCO|nr:regulatory subunit for Cdc7p protein kinase [Metschnikowia aff. pulcherrima]